MSIQRLGGGFTPSDTPSDTDIADQQTMAAQTHHRRNHRGMSSRRPSLRKRRSAETPDANDPGAESEELLQMLDQHLKKDRDATKKIDARERGGNQQAFDQDEHFTNAGKETHRDVPTGDDNAQRHARKLRLVDRDTRDESVLLKHWQAHLRGSGPLPGEQAEAALIGMHKSVRTKSSLPYVDESQPASTTYEIIAIAREFLQQLAEGESASPMRLTEIRQRLVSLSERKGRTVASASGAAGMRPLAAAEESVNLLLPIALLNISRRRTRKGRAMAISALAALIRRGRSW
ncbi:hypothetical protein [Robbsia andropogonis]|uniref:hypothetical protein n=2 Tax=Robbsia andropogonis TaxID=28092 RepID=UPI0004637DA7|nr:hypothetical protein [Robbsia andropogonis]